MAHVLIVEDNGHARLAHFRLEGDVCEIEDSSAEEERFPWRLLGLAIMTLGGAAGWVLVILAVKHFLR